MESGKNSPQREIYHATNEGYCSWYEFASEIFKQAELEVKVKPIKTEDYITKAKRPKNSRLSKRKLVQQGFSGLKEWKGALLKFIKITEK
jgi:dTDP-4-dehydrorhamnose reductase